MLNCHATQGSAPTVGVSLWLALHAVACNASPLHEAESIEEWVETSILEVCDPSYRVREVPWDEAPSDGWPVPSDAIASVEALSTEVLWDDLWVHAGSADREANSWLTVIRRIDFELRPHSRRLPVIAENARPPGDCPNLMAIPLGVRATTPDGHFTLDDPGDRFDGSWKGDSYPPWAGNIVSVLVVIGDESRVQMSVYGSTTRFSSPLQDRFDANQPDGFEEGTLRVTLGGGLDAGLLALEASYAAQQGTGAMELGLGTATYVAVAPSR